METRNVRLLHISIHAAREGGDILERKLYVHFCISIHAAREGGDFGRFIIVPQFFRISIHAAREGGDTEIFNPSQWEL